MAQKYIKVSLAGSELTITPITPNPDDPFFIADGDWLWWRFDGLPDDSYAMILFDEAFGPFQSLRSYKQTWILAKGNLGNPEIYPYTALVCASGSSAPLAVAHGQIDNQATVENLSPKARVLYQPPVAPDKYGTLEIIPSTPLQLFDGDTAVWESDNLPSGSFLNVRIVGAPWPFAAINVVRGNQGMRQVQATGFATQEDTTGIVSFSYDMELRDKDGNLLAWKDPVIDRLPPPPLGEG